MRLFLVGLSRHFSAVGRSNQRLNQLWTKWEIWLHQTVTVFFRVFLIAAAIFAPLPRHIVHRVQLSRENATETIKKSHRIATWSIFIYGCSSVVWLANDEQIVHFSKWKCHLLASGHRTNLNRSRISTFQCTMQQSTRLKLISFCAREIDSNEKFPRHYFSMHTVCIYSYGVWKMEQNSNFDRSKNQLGTGIACSWCVFVCGVHTYTAPSNNIHFCGAKFNCRPARKLQVTLFSFLFSMRSNTEYYLSGTLKNRTDFAFGANWTNWTVSKIVWRIDVISSEMLLLSSSQMNCFSSA